MAAAVQSAPYHMGAQHQYDGYSNGMSVLEDSDDGEHEFVDQDEMEHYYQQHYHQHPEQQLQYHHYQPGEDEADLEEEEVYSDVSSEESVLPDENIDFSLIYALHTFLATVEGQASVVKGDSLLLLDDANSYWWLVRVLKTEDVGYIPAENVETPYERLARLNKHRNIDHAAPTKEESALGEARERDTTNKIKNFIGWRSRNDRPSQDEEREGRRVVFAPPTYVEHPGVTWSSDEEDDEDDDEHHLDIEHEHEQIDTHLDEDGYEVEPDDGVEWAQDAVEASRGGPQEMVIQAPESSTDHSIALESRETAIMTPDDAPIAHVEVSDSKAAAAGVAAAGVAGAGITAASVAAVVATHPPPNRSPSPATPTGALARTNPTPPPHRAGVLSPELEASPEYNMRDVMTPPPASSTRATTPASSDVHTPSTPTAQNMQGQGTPSPQPKTHHRTGSAATSATITPLGAIGLASPKSAMVPIASGATAAAGAAAVVASAPTAAPAPTAAATTSPGAPVRTLSSSSTTRPLRPLQWHADAFNITRLSTLVRARADEDRRTRRPPKPTPEADAVQRTYYGERLALDALHQDLRAGYVHLQAKMDSFDREIDSLLGSLVAAH